MPRYHLPSPVAYSPSEKANLKSRRIVFVVNPRSESLEYIGPLQVFAEANFFFTRWNKPELCYDLEVVSMDDAPVFEDYGLTIRAHKKYSELQGEIDTLIFQAVDEKEVCLQNEHFVQWVADMSTRVRRMASICVGTFILAEAGVLTGRRVTTHWAASEDFRTRYPDVHLDPDPIYVKDGNIYSSAGSTSGFDLALAMVEEDLGNKMALHIAQGLILYLKRPGSQSQFSTHVTSGLAETEPMQDVQMFVLENLDANLSIQALSDRAGMSPRNFSRVFQKEFGMPPGRYVELCRLEHARSVLEQTDKPISQVASQCGYRTVDGLRLAFRNYLATSPKEYRRRFNISALA